MNNVQTSTVDLLPIKLRTGKSRLSCMELVIKHLRSNQHTSASLVQEINAYSSSQVNSCLKKLKDAGLIGAVLDNRKISFIYYNMKL